MSIFEVGLKNAWCVQTVHRRWKKGLGADRRHVEDSYKVFHSSDFAVYEELERWDGAVGPPGKFLCSYVAPSFCQRGGEHDF